MFRCTDFPKALDKIKHTELLQATRFFTLNYNKHSKMADGKFSSQSASCRYNDPTLTHHALMTGVSQGSTISSLLVNHFVSTYPDNVDSYPCSADDVHSSASLVYPQAAAVGHWARERGLQISALKSHVNHLTPDTDQSYLLPTVTLNRFLVPT